MKALARVAHLFRRSDKNMMIYYDDNHDNNDDKNDYEKIGLQ